MGQSAKPELMRRINRTLILDLLVERGPLSRADLACQSGLSAPAVSRAMSDLLTEGLVTELGAGASSGGRRPILISFNADAGAIVALDIRRHRIIGAVTNLAGQVRVRATVAAAGPGPVLLEEAVSFARELAAQAPAPLRGVAAAAPGVCGDGRVAWAPALNWDGVPLATALQDAVGCPVYVENDVNALVVGERWRGALAGCQDAVGVVVGSGGVGAGILVGGHLYRGRDGAAGEIGSWRPWPDGPDTILEEMTSVAAWARQWSAAVGGRGGVPIEDMLAALSASHPESVRIVQRVAVVLGAAVANLVTLLNPEVVVLGGEALAAADLLVPVLNAAVAAHSPYPAPVVAALLGDQAPLLGVVRGLLEQERNSVSYVR